MNIDIGEQYDKIYRYCYFKLKNQYLAEDITQETFLRFLESAGGKAGKSGDISVCGRVFGVVKRSLYHWITGHFYGIHLLSRSFS